MRKFGEYVRAEYGCFSAKWIFGVLAALSLLPTLTKTVLLCITKESLTAGEVFFCRPVLRCLRLYTHLFQDMFYPSRDAERSLEDWWKKSYYDKLNFYAQMVREGREKEFEWLRDQLLNMASHTGGTVLPNNTEAKKPNIYLYPETETEITVTFEKPEYLTSSIRTIGERGR